MMTSTAATWSLNNFYAPEENTALFEAINQRKSCRSFLSSPSAKQWDQLAAASKRLALPNTRMALGLCDTSLFQPFFGLLMKFENVQRYAAIIVRDDQPCSLVSAGVSGEMLMLCAVSIGLAGVWVSGTYKKSEVKIPLEVGEKIVALLALGLPAESPAAPIARRRKPMRELVENDVTTAPIALREVVKWIVHAPSALNRQPWRMRFDADRTLVVRTPSASLDLGVAIAHAVLALGNTPAFFTLSPEGSSVSISLKP